MTKKTCAYCCGEFGEAPMCQNCGAPYISPKSTWSGLVALGTYVAAYLDEPMKNGFSVRFYRGDTYAGDLFVSRNWQMDKIREFGSGVDFSDELVEAFDSGVRELHADLWKKETHD